MLRLGRPNSWATRLTPLPTQRLVHHPGISGNPPAIMGPQAAKESKPVFSNKTDLADRKQGPRRKNSKRGGKNLNKKGVHGGGVGDEGQGGVQGGPTTRGRAGERIWVDRWMGGAPMLLLHHYPKNHRKSSHGIAWRKRGI
jgi:hypothetical protein